MVNDVKRGFKKATIARAIEYKLNEWIKTLPQELQKDAQDNYILTGGAIASMLQGDLPNDFDVYFKDKVFLKKLCEHYLQGYVKTNHVHDISVNPNEYGVKIVIRSAGIISEGEDFNGYQYFEALSPEQMDTYFNKWSLKEPKNKKYTAKLISSNAISLWGDIQLILRFAGEPEEIHKHYDFVHCTNWYTHKDGLHLNQDALESIMAKELKYVGSMFPICSMFRIRKFIERGWTITAGEMLKITWDINKLDLNNRAVLMDQLTGVDAAYFSEFISILTKEGYFSNSEKPLDRTYLFEVLNRVFDTDEFDSIDIIKSDDSNTIAAMEDMVELDD